MPSQKPSQGLEWPSGSFKLQHVRAERSLRTARLHHKNSDLGSHTSKIEQSPNTQSGIPSCADDFDRPGLQAPWRAIGLFLAPFASGARLGFNQGQRGRSLQCNLNAALQRRSIRDISRLLRDWSFSSARAPAKCERLPKSVEFMGSEINAS